MAEKGCEMEKPPCQTLQDVNEYDQGRREPVRAPGYFIAPGRSGFPKHPRLFSIKILRALDLRPMVLSMTYYSEWGL